ncbi:class I SAM-dependent methyltransferase, partial [Nocardia gipuzkoensis]
MVDTYADGPFNMDEPTERDRLLLLQRYRDDDTFQVLRSLPMTSAWRCLEIGAGTGSVAYWLGEQCPNGRTVAVDTDTRNLDPDRLPNVEVLAADITTHEFPTAAFDLIHARAVLCHLPQREE